MYCGPFIEFSRNSWIDDKSSPLYSLISMVSSLMLSCMQPVKGKIKSMIKSKIDLVIFFILKCLLTIVNKVIGSLEKLTKTTIYHIF